jgi:hypothetical protein
MENGGWDATRPDHFDLADVLLAITKGKPILPFEGMGLVPDGVQEFTGDMQKAIAEWNLRDDDLEHQSEETRAFIASLLP